MPLLLSLLWSAEMVVPVRITFMGQIQNLWEYEIGIFDAIELSIIFIKNNSYNSLLKPYSRIFLHQCQLMSFHRSLIDTKSPKSPGLFLVFWLISTMLWIVLIFKFSIPSTSPLVTVPIGIIIPFMFHNF